MADSTEQVRDQVVASRAALVRFAQTRPLTLFFWLTYAWTWTLWLGVGSYMPDDKAESYGTLLVLTGGFGPMVAALITRWLSDRDFRICRVWTGWCSLATGLVFGLGAFFVALLVAPPAALVKAPVYALNWSSLLHWSTYAINYSTFIGGPVNEEPGWRGFALPRLQERYGLVRATLILAPLWAGWHLPRFQIKGWSSANPWQFLLILVGVSFLLTATANISKFNVVVAIVLHAFFNTSSGLGNALTNVLPRRAHEMKISTLVVLIGGVVVGLAALRVHGRVPARVAEDAP
ncbi:MAG TPA: type II CAAX endopeptidase family protein [Candidatus Sulfotelmatobacter sp.]